jgi:hypothetical protein
MRYPGLAHMDNGLFDAKPLEACRQKKVYKELVEEECA